MEEVLDLYEQPYQADEPEVCFDETSNRECCRLAFGRRNILGAFWNAGFSELEEKGYNEKPTGRENELFFHLVKFAPHLLKCGWQSYTTLRCRPQEPGCP